MHNGSHRPLISQYTRAVKVEAVDEALIQSVCARLHEHLPADQAVQAEAFVRQYYRWVSPDDLDERSALDVYGAALSHFNLARTRRPGTANVRVYNPDFETSGWQSARTAVEIVTDDMPFLIDSVGTELNRRGFGVHLIIHPVITVSRDADGALLEVLGPQTVPVEGLIAESVIHAEVQRQTAPAQLEALRDHLLRVIGEVRAAVEDWPQMRERPLEIAAELHHTPPPVDPEEVAETRAFLVWLADHHFTFVGYREYEIVTEDDEVRLSSVPASGLGILRQTGDRLTSHGFEKLPPGVRALALEPHLLNLTKANSRATVHRASHLDYVGVKRFDAEGRVVGERRFLGLYTTIAYHASPRDIPILRRKVAAVLTRAGFPPESHSEKALIEILETYPRDELFQMSVDELFDIAMGILNLGERQRVRLFVRRDTFGRFLSCLVFVPRDRFNTENRRRIEHILRESFAASKVDYTTRVSESALVRLHYLVYTEPGRVPDFDPVEVEAKVVAATRSWADDLQEALIDHHGEDLGSSAFRRYADAFPAAYRADWPARSGLADIARIDGLPERDGLVMSLYQQLEAPPDVLRAKLFRSGTPLALSDMIPMFENMGVEVADERPYEVRPLDGEPVWIYDFGLTRVGAPASEADQVRESFQEAFIHAWRGDVENDGYNRLVLAARLSWREITVLRAVARYLRQTGTTSSDHYVEQALVAHPQVARLLVELFCARFDPADVDAERADRLSAEIAAAIEAVESLDHDRILHLFLDVVGAMLRTNYFQPDAGGAPRPYLSFKLDPHRLKWLPHPRPLFEIFVYSPRTEGVHLRGGKVSRGGIRWSDRREDFRTEVLGLMKAQMVKNAVIVPVGAKGGFVVKQPPSRGGREALLEEVIACYSTFIRGLLDLTDTIAAGEIAAPSNVVRYDDDDPYLVVAADKGTATFSDIANSIAAEYGFWLGDAFASGGSSGYDHKAMGITARGAWESVRRHFRELGRDTQESDFTVVGIGDMSGDVFGNGMLLSPHIRLIGAFNHREIFLDPDPDPAVGFEERQRLFALPRSSWSDYDRARISAGGGVFERTAKSIPLSPQARAALGLEAESLTPTELIRGLLQAPADLLWNGGIGTYVKASSETHPDAGDRANDAVRVDADTLRCLVVGEGGNLGLTQPGRIQYAGGGGRVNTDAIDNSGGVDCSDHEVNIKILLDAVVADGDLTVKQRDELLARMTGDVAALVLKNDYEQGETISLAEAQAASMLDIHARFIGSLEHAGALDAALEHLPSAEVIGERRKAGRGLTRPELATLVAYAKVDLYTELLDSDVPEDPYLSVELSRYFPSPLPERFTDRMESHRLRREITTTNLVNNMVHGAGSTFAFRLREETGAFTSDIARAYAVADEVFQMLPQWAEIESLDNQVDAAVQIQMLLDGRRLVERGSRWLLNNRRRPLDVAATVDFFAAGAAELYATLPGLLDVADREPLTDRADQLRSAGVPNELALRVAGLSAMVAALDIVEVATQMDLEVGPVAMVHFHLGNRLELHWLSDKIVALPRGERWEALARAALRDDLTALHRALTADVLSAGGEGDVDARVSAWVDANPAAERCLQTLADVRVGRVYDLTTLPVVVREVRNLIQSPESGEPGSEPV